MDGSSSTYTVGEPVLYSDDLADITGSPAWTENKSCASPCLTRSELSPQSSGVPLSTKNYFQNNPSETITGNLSQSNFTESSYSSDSFRHFASRETDTRWIEPSLSTQTALRQEQIFISVSESSIVVVDSDTGHTDVSTLSLNLSRKTKNIPVSTPNFTVKGSSEHQTPSPSQRGDATVFTNGLLVSASGFKEDLGSSKHDSVIYTSKSTPLFVEDNGSLELFSSAISNSPSYLTPNLSSVVVSPLPTTSQDTTPSKDLETSFVPFEIHQNESVFNIPTTTFTFDQSSLAGNKYIDLSLAQQTTGLSSLTSELENSNAKLNGKENDKVTNYTNFLSSVPGNNTSLDIDSTTVLHNQTKDHGGIHHSGIHVDFSVNNSVTVDGSTSHWIKTLNTVDLEYSSKETSFLTQNILQSFSHQLFDGSKNLSDSVETVEHTSYGYDTPIIETLKNASYGVFTVSESEKTNIVVPTETRALRLHTDSLSPSPLLAPPSYLSNKSSLIIETDPTSQIPLKTAVHHFDDPNLVAGLRSSSEVSHHEFSTPEKENHPSTSAIFLSDEIKTLTGNTGLTNEKTDTLIKTIKSTDEYQDLTTPDIKGTVASIILSPVFTQPEFLSSLLTPSIPFIHPSLNIEDLNKSGVEIMATATGEISSSIPMAPAPPVNVPLQPSATDISLKSIPSTSIISSTPLLSLPSTTLIGTESLLEPTTISPVATMIMPKSGSSLPERDPLITATKSHTLTSVASDFVNSSGSIQTTPKPPINVETTTVAGSASPDATTIHDTTIIIASASAVVVLLIFLLIALIYTMKKKKRTKSSPRRARGDELWIDLSSSDRPNQLPLPSLTTCPSAYEMAPITKEENLYKAHYTYEACQEGQLQLKEGDLVQLVEKADNGWWRGVTIKDGLSGWFPSSYVTSVSDSNENETEEKQKSTENPSPLVCRVKPTRQVSSFQIKKSVTPTEKVDHPTYPVFEDQSGMDPVECWVNMAASISVGSLPTTEMSYNTNMTDYIAASVGRKFRAVYAYKPVCKGEMGLKEGELVICRERDRNGWMYGFKPITNEEGWFPAVYVDETTDDDELLNKGDIPETYEMLESNKLHGMHRSWIGIEHKALYNYESDAMGDLNINIGDVITVLQTLANGWWFGIKGEDCGWFPGSHMELIEDDTPPQLVNNPQANQIQPSPDNQLERPADTNIQTAVNTSSDTPNEGGNDNEVSKTTSNNKQEQQEVTFSNSVSNNEKSETPVIPTNKQPSSMVTQPSLDNLKSKQQLRPSRKAPAPPSFPPNKNLAEIQGGSLRRPSRPAPAPPKRRNSKLTMEGSINDLMPVIAKASESKAPVPVKPVLLIQGKKPLLRKVPCTLIDEKQLEPMIRPSMRGFMPVPSENNDDIRGSKRDSDFSTNRYSSHSFAEECNNEVMALLNQSPTSNVSLPSQLSPSDKLNAEHSLNNGNKLDHGGVQSPSIASNASTSIKGTSLVERSITPEFRKERSHSPALPTTGHLLQNVQRFNRSLRGASPSPSLDSERGSVKSVPTMLNPPEHVAPRSASPRMFQKRTGQRRKTLTTVPPPSVPSSHSRKMHRTKNQMKQTLADEHQKPISSVSFQSVSHSQQPFVSDTFQPLQTQEPKVTDGEQPEAGRRPSNVTIPILKEISPGRDSLKVAPGTVSGIVRHINTLTPLEKQVLKISNNNGDTKTQLQGTEKKTSNAGLQGYDNKSDQNVPFHQNGESHGALTTTEIGNTMTNGQIDENNSGANEKLTDDKFLETGYLPNAEIQIPYAPADKITEL